MINQDEIDNYLNALPPLPKILQDCIENVNKGDLVSAASSAAKDPILSKFLCDLSKKSVYGFSKPITDVNQIFGVLGLAQSRNIIQNYALMQFLPDTCKVFRFDKDLLGKFQDDMLFTWLHVLKQMGIKNESYESLAPLTSATIIVCEGIFSNYVDAIRLIKNFNKIDYSTILYRLTKMSLDQLALKVAANLNIPDEAKVIYEILSQDLEQQEDNSKEEAKVPQENSEQETAKQDEANNDSEGQAEQKTNEAENVENNENTQSPSYSEEQILVAKNLHLLSFYIFSKTDFMKLGLAELIEFKTDFVSEETEKFQKMVESYGTNSKK